MCMRYVYIYIYIYILRPWIVSTLSCRFRQQISLCRQQFTVGVSTSIESNEGLNATEDNYKVTPAANNNDYQTNSETTVKSIRISRVRPRCAPIPDKNNLRRSGHTVSWSSDSVAKTVTTPGIEPAGSEAGTTTWPKKRPPLKCSRESSLDCSCMRRHYSSTAAT